MNSIQTNKQQLYEFIIKKFPGDWEEKFGSFYLPIKNNKGTIINNIVFSCNENYKNGFLDVDKFCWKTNLPIKEIEKYYKKYYKMINFK